MTTSKNSLNLATFQDPSEPATWYAIPQEIPELEMSLDLADEFVEAVTTAVSNGEQVVLSGAHVYERKGYISRDKLGGSRNKSYGSDSDDVVLQLTVRVSSHSVAPLLEKLKQENEIRAERERQQARDELDAQIAELTARRDAI